MTLAERVAVIESCKYVDEVIADSPDRLTQGFLDEHKITTVVHGDDLSPEGAESVYGPAAAAGKFVFVPRTGAISTTQVIQRVLDAAAERSDRVCRERVRPGSSHSAAAFRALSDLPHSAATRPGAKSDFANTQVGKAAWTRVVQSCPWLFGSSPSSPRTDAYQPPGQPFTGTA